MVPASESQSPESPVEIIDQDRSEQINLAVSRVGKASGDHTKQNTFWIEPQQVESISAQVNMKPQVIQIKKW
jgi:hypothetical protein